MTRRTARYATVLAGQGYRIGSPVSAAINTDRSNDLTPDGFTWAQGTPMVIDNYGKWIVQLQHYGAASAISSAFIHSNDEGATWTDTTLTSFASSDGELFITRGGMAYDTVHDQIHMLWAATSATDGIIYRRYTIQRDGSNNITGMTRAAGINLQLDFQGAGTMEYQHPVLMFLNDGTTHGSIIAVWAAKNSAGAGNKIEIRMSRRVLSNDVNDNTAGNWTHVTTAATDSLGNAPAVAYSTVFSSTNTGMPYVSANYKPEGEDQWDIVFLYSTGAAAPVWATKVASYSAGPTWTLQSASNAASVATGVDGGYSQKVQLGTEPRFHTASGKTFFGYCNWPLNGGDSWRFACVLPTNIAAVFSAVPYLSPAAHNSADDFVTGDVAVFPGVGIFVTYTDLPNKDVYAKLYSFTGGLISGPTLIFDTAPADIPTVYPHLVGGEAIVVFRDFNPESTDNPPVYTPPYAGYIVRVPITQG